jgi:hypothetical protein
MNTLSRQSREGGNPVIPHPIALRASWIPAFAGMTREAMP